MAMGKERKFMPLLIFVFIVIFIFGFVRMLNALKPTARVLSYKDSVCKEMFVSEAIMHAQGSNCMDVGTLDVYSYKCNEGIGRIDFPMVLSQENEEGKTAKCTVFTSSGNTHLLWVNSKELE